MIWFTSDQHFSHSNIIKLCGRPFKDVAEMDQTLIDNWNAVVQQTDTVYVLGDFAYKGNKGPTYYCRQLNGTKHLIRGNHDKKPTEVYEECFASVRDIEYLEIDGKLLVLFHYPILSWKQRARGSYHLYGHVHTAQLDVFKEQKAMNVCVDVHNFAPVSYESIKQEMKTRGIKTKD